MLGERNPASSALDPRLRGRPGRLEVWYATMTEPSSGTGAWLHHEVVYPVEGECYGHGWAALFPPGQPPVVRRFGPAPPEVLGRDELFAAADVRVVPGWLEGSADAASWSLRWEDGSPPLFTFPLWAWRRELLPGGQVVPAPTARISGTLEVSGHRVTFDNAPGNIAHIFGHANAERWGWLHAGLGGGDVLEIVAAVPRGLSRLPPMAMVQLRLDGRDWPRDPLLAAPLFRARLGLPEWRVRGTVGRRRIRVAVTIPPDEAVRLAYADSDGAGATCTNSERAGAEILLERWDRGWQVERQWSLAGSAHAEIGTRP